MKYRVIKLSGYEKYKVQQLLTVGFFKKRKKWIDVKVKSVYFEEDSYVPEYNSIKKAQREIDRWKEFDMIKIGNWEPIGEN